MSEIRRQETGYHRRRPPEALGNAGKVRRNYERYLALPPQRPRRVTTSKPRTATIRGTLFQRPTSIGTPVAVVS
jgi:hypothetical protein